MGVPVILGGKGVEKIVELALNGDEEGDAREERQQRKAIVDVVKKN